MLPDINGPCVINYDNPENLLMNRLNKLPHQNPNFERNINYNQKRQLNPSQNNLYLPKNRQLNRVQKIQQQKKQEIVQQDCSKRNNTPKSMF